MTKQEIYVDRLLQEYEALKNSGAINTPDKFRKLDELLAKYLFEKNKLRRKNELENKKAKE